jgi:hypothetical protein
VAQQDSPGTPGREVLIGLTRLAEPWAVRVAATLRLADLAADGGSELEDLATRAGADPGALGCLLRFLAARGVFAEPAPGVFAVNDAARWLREDHPGRLRRWLDLDGAAGAMDRAYAGLLETVRSGQAAYPALSGQGLWQDLAADPRLAASFASLMQAHSSELADDVVAGYPWAQMSLVADVGGGTGILLARILSSHPHLRGILVDLISDSPQAAKVLKDAGVADRCQPVVTDFFGPLPAGADVYLLRNIIHDWPDEQAVAILRRCAQAARGDGRVLVVERVVTSDGDQHELTNMDLRMLLLFGSRERALDEFNALASAAGMRPVTTRATTSSYWLLEYAPGQHGLDPFEDRGDALAAADAHRDQRVPAAGPAQFVEGLDDQDGTGGAERVTQGDAAAVRVGPFRRQAELGGDGEGLRGERLVHLEHVDVIHLQVGALKNLAHRGYRPDAHHARLDPGVAVGDEPADRVISVPFGIIPVGQDHGRCGVVDARSVAGGDRAFLGEGRLQPGQVG